MSRKKTQKTGLASQLPLAIKTGDYKVGLRQTLDALVHNKAKVVVVAKNLPEHLRKKIEYYCVLSGNVPIEFFPGNNNELNTLSGVGKRCSVISILDQGEADFAESK